MRGGHRDDPPFGPDVLARGLDWRDLFAVEEDYVDRLAFDLLWHEHGGSGLALNLADIDNIEISRALLWLEWVGERREAEADAIRGSNGEGGIDGGESPTE